MIDVTAQFPIPLVWPRLLMDLARVDAIAVHHTAVDPRGGGEALLLFPAAEMTQEDELNHIRVIHLYHKSKGFGGFAYHFIVFPSGRVYYIVPLTQWGAHVFGENDHLPGIVLAGDFTSTVPGLPQREGAAEAISTVYDALGRRVPIRPHRAWGGTVCPGNTWREWVPRLIELVDKEEESINASRDETQQLRSDLEDHRRGHPEPAKRRPGRTAALIAGLTALFTAAATALREIFTR